MFGFNRVAILNNLREEITATRHFCSFKIVEDKKVLLDYRLL